MADVIVTVPCQGEYSTAISKSPAKLGYPSHKTNIDIKPYFLDFPFTVEGANFDDHLKMVKKHKPKIAVSPDIEKGLTLEDAISQADELLRYADDVILVPKSVKPELIPDRFRVGLTLANYGTSAPWWIWDYRECQSVHLLGGSPNRQIRAINHGLKVDSLDTSTLSIICKYGIWKNGLTVDAPEGWDYSKRVIESLKNYVGVVNQIIS
jgi:hypothetical protein